MEILMNDAVHVESSPADQPLLDTTAYGFGKDDSITDAAEAAAITQHTVTIKGTAISYTARAGHLVTTGRYWVVGCVSFAWIVWASAYKN